MSNVVAGQLDIGHWSFTILEPHALKKIDFLLLAAVVLLSLWGCLTIYSAKDYREPTATQAGRARFVASGNTAEATFPPASSFAKKQAVWLVVGLCLMAGLMRVDYHLWGMASRWIYLANVLFLLLVLVVGREVKGAQRWIFLGPVQLQPSEFAKVAIILTLAVFLHKNYERIHQPKTVLWGGAHILLPWLLIFKQPDLGTSLTFIAIWFGMMFVAGARWWHLGTVLLCGILLFAIAWKMDVIKPYQKSRLTAFLNAEAVANKEGYHITQAQIAIGAGGLHGQGLFRGSQNRLNFIPEDYTDFIFPVVAEEWGFVGSVVLLCLYFVVLWRGLTLMRESESVYGSLVAGGIFSLLAFHIFVNVGMTLRLTPITGVPLPFFSYGGSAMLTFLIAVGILESIAIRRQRMMFR
jgi:rod shape determining protein RodA